MTDDAALLAVLESLRERGALGESSLPRAIEHAECFVAAIPSTARRLLDLGSGGGLPGLVIAARRPALEIVLTDRRERRADLLRLACSQLGFGGRVAVVASDVGRLAADADYAGTVDVVTARSFGEPVWTLRCAIPFLARGGLVIVSEPPEAVRAGRWPSSAIAALGMRMLEQDDLRVRCFQREE